jgi:hypothetical protein
MLYAFNLLELNGEDMRLPQSNAVLGHLSRWDSVHVDPGEVVSMQAVHLVYSTSPGITIGSDLRSFIGSQLCVLPCMSVATTRYVSDPVG